MTRFDPFTADETEALAQANSQDFPWSPHRQWQSVQVLNEHKYDFVANPLIGIAICFEAKLLVPTWLSDAYMLSFKQVNSGHKKSWDDVFPQPFPKGTHTKSVRSGSAALLNWQPVMTGLVHHLFTGPEKYPKTRLGRKMAAQKLGITEKQLRDLLPQVLGKRNYERVSRRTTPNIKATPNSANNPFDL
jgi:hypothetical protein